MLKVKKLSTAFVRNPQLTYGENLAENINRHWGCAVAAPTVDGWNVHSTLAYGVPKAANTGSYRHPDIIHVARVSQHVWMVTRK